MRLDYLKLADKPVPSVRFMRLRDWEAIDDRTVVLWVGRQEPYLIKLKHSCEGLTFNYTIGVTSTSHRLTAMQDRVITADGQCLILSIQPLDYAALHAAQVEMRRGREVSVRDRFGGATGTTATAAREGAEATGPDPRERVIREPLDRAAFEGQIERNRLAPERVERAGSDKD